MQRAAGNGAHDHDARRERHRHRRAGPAGAGRRAHRPGLARPHPAARAGGRGHRPGHPAGPGGRRAAVHRAPVGQAGAGRGDRGPRPRRRRVRRDLPAVPVPVAGRPGQARLRGGQVRGLAAAAAQASTGSTCGGACAPTTCRWCPPTTARSASRTRRSSAGATSPRSRTASPGVEHRIDLLHQGVADGELSPARWVEVNSTTPARMFGLYPRKGTIAPGSDADIVIYDPNARHVLSAATHHMTWTTRPTRAARCRARSRPCSPGATS